MKQLVLILNGSAKMTARTETLCDRIIRTGNINSPFRQLIAVIGEGRTRTEIVLSPRINKVEWGLQFRHGSARTPVEQYAYEVNGVVFERFADAASVVMNLNGVKINSLLGDLQIYVRRALAIIEGRDQIRIITDLPATIAPAVGRVGRTRAA